MINVKHILLTRFNVSFLETNEDINDYDWLSHRYELFEKYCFASIRNQITKPDIWLVFFDSNLPPYFKEKNKKLMQSFNIFKPIYLRTYSKAILAKSVSAFVNGNKSLVLTTRIDNDDAISENFFLELKKCLEQNDFKTGYYNQKKGFNFSVKDRRLFFIDEYNKNPFISYLEENREHLSTVFNVPHTQIDKTKKYFNIEAESFFMILIHSKNFINTIYGKPVSMFSNSLFTWFPQNLNKGIDKLYLINNLNYYRNRAFKLLKRVIKNN